MLVVVSLMGSDEWYARVLALMCIFGREGGVPRKSLS